MAISGYYNSSTSVTICEPTRTSCSRSTYEGYFVNSDMSTNSDYRLIYCEGFGIDFKCENTRAVENGYYWNEYNNPTYGVIICENELTICDNNGCRVTSVGTDCADSSDYKHKVIHNENQFKYCKDGTINGGTAVRNSGLKYYVGSDNFEPESKFNYPTRFKNAAVPEREILIKTQRYSVTAVTGDNIPIGYVKVENKYLECKYNEEGKKVCVDADVTATECTSDKVGKLITTATGTELCVDPDPTIGSVDISTGDGEYLIPLGSGKFGINGRNDGKEYFIGVKVSEGNVIVVKGNEKVLRK